MIASFLLLLLLRLFRGRCIIVRLSGVLAESDGAKDTHTRGHLKDQHRVACQVRQSAITRLLVKNGLEAASKCAYKKSISNCQRVANEEVTQRKVLIKRYQGLLKFVLALREGNTIALYLSVNHAENARGDGHHIGLHVVCPGVDLRSLLGANTGHELRVGAAEVASDREPITHEQVVLLTVLVDGEATRQRLFTELFVISGHFDDLEGIDLYELGNKSRELCLGRRLFACFYKEFTLDKHTTNISDHEVKCCLYEDEEYLPFPSIIND